MSAGQSRCGRYPEGVFDANVRLEKIIDFLEIDDGEEEEENPDS
jgi:hypothetical protein